MGEAGIFHPDARLELLEGNIYELPPISPPHAACVTRISMLFHRLFDRRLKPQIKIRSGWTIFQSRSRTWRCCVGVTIFTVMLTRRQPTCCSSSKLPIQQSKATAPTRFRSTRRLESLKSGSSIYLMNQSSFTQRPPAVPTKRASLSRVEKNCALMASPTYAWPSRTYWVDAFLFKNSAHPTGNRLKSSNCRGR